MAEYPPKLTISYSIQANPLAGFNGNHFVDGADCLIWKRGFGIASGATQGAGDANGDGP
jgi:hypothetical protein